MKKLLATIGVVTLLVGSAGVALAIPTSDPNNPAVTYTAGNPSAASIAAFIAGPAGVSIRGEGAAPNTCIGQATPECLALTGGTVVGATAVQHVDYVVTKLSDTVYLYQYQFENSSIAVAELVTVVSKNFTSIGVAPGDLDTTGPHNLVGELESAPICCDAAAPSATSPYIPGVNNATWDFLNPGPPVGIQVGHESIILNGLGPQPIFVRWSAQNDFTWASDAPNPLGGEVGRPVLAPGTPTAIPEPGSLLLLGSGMVGVGLVARRHLRRSAK